MIFVSFKIYMNNIIYNVSGKSGENENTAKKLVARTQRGGNDKIWNNLDSLIVLQQRHSIFIFLFSAE